MQLNSFIKLYFAQASTELQTLQIRPWNLHVSALISHIQFDLCKTSDFVLFESRKSRTAKLWTYSKLASFDAGFPRPYLYQMHLYTDAVRCYERSLRMLRPGHTSCMISFDGKQASHVSSACMHYCGESSGLIFLGAAQFSTKTDRETIFWQSHWHHACNIHNSCSVDMTWIFFFFFKNRLSEEGLLDTFFLVIYHCFNPWLLQSAHPSVPGQDAELKLSKCFSSKLNINDTSNKMTLNTLLMGIFKGKLFYSVTEMKCSSSTFPGRLLIFPTFSQCPPIVPCFFRFTIMSPNLFLIQ